MNKSGSRSKIPSQTINQKPQQKQKLGLIRDGSKMQLQSWQEYQPQYPAKAEQNPVARFDEQNKQQQASHQLLANHPMLAAQYFVLHVYGQEQQKQYYMAMTPEQVQALNDCYYQEFMYKQLLEQKKQECLQSPQKSRNMDDGQFFTSFLYSENSFLTPWSWNPDQPPRTEENRRMMFQPGSFFSYQMPSARIKEEECSRQEED